MKKICVFFDGKCNICSREINYYKKKDQKEIFEWIDINQEEKKLSKYDISFNESLMYLHVIDRSGQTLIGVDAFLAIWKEFKYLRILSVIVGIFPIKFIAHLIYIFWAKRRYNKLKYKCEI